MISVKQALYFIEKFKYSLKSEYVIPEQALGRVVSENILSKANNPPFNMSAMDGYAVTNKSKNNIYKVVSQVYAGGKTFKPKITKNQAVRVFTGSKLPIGTTSIIIQEDVKVLNEKNILLTNKYYKKGKYIRKEGMDFKRNNIIISKGTALNARHLALLVSANCKRIKV